MELIEIIKSSLSIFSTTALLFIAISYTVYKIKDSYKTKPHLRLNVQKSISGIINNEIGIDMDKPKEEVRFNGTVLNKLPIQDRFTIFNGEVRLNKSIKQEKEDSLFGIMSNDEKKNIFDIYTIPDEKMNNLKFVIR
jgi:hypothetical protein